MSFPGQYVAAGGVGGNRSARPFVQGLDYNAGDFIGGSMTIAAELSLVGILLEVIAGFILAIDAIGMDKIRRWRRLLLLVPRQKPSLLAAVAGLALMSTALLFGFLTVAVLVINVALSGGVLEKDHLVLKDSLAWLTAGGRNLFTASQIVLAVLAMVMGITFGVSRLLRRLEMLADRRAAGVLGFSIFCVGASLQFIGTLLPALS